MPRASLQQREKLLGLFLMAWLGMGQETSILWLQVEKP